MSVLEKVERALVTTRRPLWEVCREFNIDMPDQDELCVSNCTQCSVWHYNYKLSEDLDGNPVCKYCEDLFGL